MHIVNEPEKMQKAFLWENSTPKIYNGYKGEGRKDIGISNEIISLNCSWIRRLYENLFHEWTLIQL